MRARPYPRLHGSWSLSWRPEWWVTAIIAAAWTAMLAGTGMGSANTGIHQIGLSMVSWCTPAGMPAMHLGSSQAPFAAITETPAWSLMIVAMMLPVTLPAVRHVALNTMRHRRQRAISLYTAVYVGWWTLFGLIGYGAKDVLAGDAGIGEHALLTLTFAAAGYWQLSRSKRRALFACSGTVPLPPTGWRADAACARFATLHATRCIKSCWAIMLIMLAGARSPIWMLALTALVVGEELTIAGRRLTRPSALMFAAAAAAVAVGA